MAGGEPNSGTQKDCGYNRAVDFTCARAPLLADVPRDSKECSL